MFIFFLSVIEFVWLKLLLINTIYNYIHADSPISPNPSVTIQTANPSLLVKWSPPFLWPGQRINHFNISIRNISSDLISHRIVNTTFSDTLVTFSKFIEPEQREHCSEIEFAVSAVAKDGGTLQPFTVKSGYPVCELTF